MRKRDDNDAINESIELISDAEETSSEWFGERRVLSIEDLLKEAGGFGPWHLYSFVLCILIGCLSTTYIYTMPFLETKPQLICQKEDGSEYFCDSTEICIGEEINSNIKFKVDYDDDATIANWITQMDLYWIGKFKIGLFGSVYFLGFCFSGLILMLADKYGRKKLTIFGTALVMVWIITLYFCTNLDMAYVCIFFTGLSVFRVYSVYMIWLEMSEKHVQVHLSSIFLAMKSAISVFLPGFYFLMGGTNWRVPYGFITVIAPFCLLATFFLPESPRFYYASRRYRELRGLITKIAKSNGVVMNENYDIDKQIQESNETKNVAEPSKLSYLKDPTILSNLVVVIICYIGVSFNTYLIGFHMKYIKGNLYFLAIVSCISDWVATFISSFIQKLFGTQKTIFYSFIMTIVCAWPLIILPDVKWLIPFWMFLCKFGISVAFSMMYYINTEIFPTLFVSLAFTLGNMFSRGATVLAPEVAELDPPLPMEIFVLLLILCSISVFTKVNKENQESTRNIKVADTE